MGWIANLFGQNPVWEGAPRSPKWGALRNRFVKENPFCAGCGDIKDLTVHHIIPFHVRKDLELDECNLVSVCNDCHWNICHLRDWRMVNSHCLDDLLAYKIRYAEARVK